MHKDSGPINDCQEALISLSEISLLNNSQLCLTTFFPPQNLSHSEVTRSKKRREGMKPSKCFRIPQMSVCKTNRLANLG